MNSTQSNILLTERQVSITIQRLAHQLLENDVGFSETLLVALQPGGVELGNRIKAIIEKQIGHPIEMGILDTTFFRDDIRNKENPLIPYNTSMPFIVEGRHVVFIDDVIFYGRSIRAALTAIQNYGRPEKVELLVLIDRRFRRDLPIQPDYRGRTVDANYVQDIVVQWRGIDHATEDQVITRDKAGADQ